MFTRQIFETLPIAVIALSILLMALIHSPFSLITGGSLILLSCVILYRRYLDLGTNPDVLDYVRVPRKSA
jgi:hypothetical protein